MASFKQDSLLVKLKTEDRRKLKKCISGKRNHICLFLFVLLLPPCSSPTWKVLLRLCHGCFDREMGVEVVVLVVGGAPTRTLGTIVLQLLTVFSLEVGFVALLDEAVHEIHQVCNPGGVSGSTQLESPPGSEDHSVDGAALTSDLRLVTYDNVSRDLSLTDRQTAVH